MGYIIKEEVARYHEIHQEITRFHEICSRASVDKEIEDFESILHTMAKRIVSTSTRILDKKAEAGLARAMERQKEYGYAGHVYDGFGLTDEGLCEAFGRITKKGNVKLRKTRIIWSEWNTVSEGYTASIKPEVIEFLTSLKTTKNIKDKDRLEAMLVLLDELNKLKVSNFRKEYTFPLQHVGIIGPDDDGVTCDYTAQITKICFKVKPSYGTKIELTLNTGRNVSLDGLPWHDFELISLPKTSSEILNILRTVNQQAEKDLEQHFENYRLLKEKYGEYLIVGQL